MRSKDTDGDYLWSWHYSPDDAVSEGMEPGVPGVLGVSLVEAAWWLELANRLGALETSGVEA